MRKIREVRVPLVTALFLSMTAALLAVLCCVAALSWRTPAVADKLREIDRIAADRYIGTLDETAVADYAAVGYVTGLGDVWSSYIPAEQYEAYKLNTEGKSCGIGVMVVTDEKGLHISRIYDDSPAARAGMQQGDCIVGADGLTVPQDGAEAVLEAIQGEEGTPVTLTVRRGGSTLEMTMTRAIVTQKMAWGQMLEDDTGYLRIENFHVGSAEQFQAALDALVQAGARAIVLDVRHNGGGRVKEMSAMLDPLLPEGTIMTLRTKDGEEIVYSSDAAQLDLPLAVLIDEQSISAAEFFAAALQEYDRALLVGTHTTGKGRAQRTFELSDGSAVNLSVEEYFTPQGKSLAGVGIAPEVEAPLTGEQWEAFWFFTPENDPQIQKAAEMLK